jgi:hypothetical protein
MTKKKIRRQTQDRTRIGKLKEIKGGTQRSEKKIGKFIKINSEAKYGV